MSRTRDFGFIVNLYLPDSRSIVVDRIKVLALRRSFVRGARTHRVRDGAAECRLGVSRRNLALLWPGAKGLIHTSLSS